MQIFVDKGLTSIGDDATIFQSINEACMVHAGYFKYQKGKKMKKITKRIIALALCLTFVFALTACSGEKKTDDSNKSTVSDKDADTSTDAKDTLIMATNAAFPPYEYYEGNEIVGIDAEIMAAIADKLGMTLQIEDIEFGAIVAGVESGKYDVGAAGMTVTEERQQSVNFTKSYATGIQSIIVKEDSPITTVDDLSADGAAYVVGVQQDTTGDIYSTDDFGDARVQRYNKGADAVLALTSGKIDCVIIDNEPAKAFVAANEGIKILDTEYAVEDYAICIAKDNDELLNSINDALDELIADGTVQGIIDKYIPAE